MGSRRSRQSLKADTIASLGVRHEIRVIPNFLDCAEYRRRFDPGSARGALPAGRLRRAGRSRVELPAGQASGRCRRDRSAPCRQVRARLLLIGDGPVRARCRTAGAPITDMTRDVIFLGEQQDLVPYLSVADLFLLPSAQESFGLAALEAMACEVPVIASNVGGLPEIVRQGITGFTSPPDAIEELFGPCRVAD